MKNRLMAQFKARAFNIVIMSPVKFEPFVWLASLPDF